MPLYWTENRYTGVVSSWDFVYWQADLIWIFMVLIFRGNTVFKVTSRPKIYFSAVDCKRMEASKHMEMGKEFLSMGHKLLLKARIERGNVLLKQGDIHQAKADFEAAAKADPSNADVSKKLSSVEEVRQIIEEADDYFAVGDLASAEPLYSSAIKVCHWYADLYKNRAKCREKLGDVQKAIADYRIVTKLLPDSTETFYKISQLYYLTGDVEQSLNQVRECLKLNPDDELCFPFYKKARKLAKMRESLNQLVREERWMDCLDKAMQILKTEKKVENIQLDVYRQTCKCNLNAGHFAESIAACSEVLKVGDPNDVDVLCDRAEAFLMYEKYDEAIEDYQKALRGHEESRRAREGLHRAQKLKKQKC
uniref:TPR_REGION domain-containing protein n=1 Tax=Wuchereria bancrofti TaxID=6293 RepID=A0A1I8EUH7_WUCBA